MSLMNTNVCRFLTLKNNRYFFSFNIIIHWQFNTISYLFLLEFAIDEETISNDGAYQWRNLLFKLN